MAQPIQQDFPTGKQELLKVFPDALRSAGLKVIGMDDDLGVISFKNGGDHILYAHVREESENVTRVSVAPGMSELRDQAEPKVPVNTIRKLMEALQDKVNSS